LVGLIGPSYYTTAASQHQRPTLQRDAPILPSHHRFVSRSKTMKIYTKTGDQGDTGLFGGPRVSKDDVRIEAYGTVDELNAFLGQARAEQLPPEITPIIARAQNCLFTIGAELATPNPGKQRTTTLDAAAVRELEAAIDQIEATLPLLREFILPGGNRAAAALHVARSVCRRAERRVVTLSRQAGVELSEEVVQYLNRLSDYLFVAARFACHAVGDAEVKWQKD